MIIDVFTGGPCSLHRQRQAKDPLAAIREPPPQALSSSASPQWDWVPELLSSRETRANKSSHLGS